MEDIRAGFLVIARLRPLNRAELISTALPQHALAPRQ